MLHCDSGSRIENYIRFHQAGLTRCSDQVYGTLNGNPEKQKHIVVMFD
ncbi:hypothetical protein [Pedobacter sp. BS3]|nr:hypothetical protein [Pedobacter sp. BS3]